MTSAPLPGDPFGDARTDRHSLHFPPLPDSAAGQLNNAYANFVPPLGYPSYSGALAYPDPLRRSTNVLAVAALVAALAAAGTCFYLPGFAFGTSLAAMLLGVFARYQINRSGDDGQAMAFIGFVTGLAVTCSYLLGFSEFGDI